MADKDFESTGGIDPTEFAADLFPADKSNDTGELSAPSGGSSEAVSSPEHAPPADSSPVPTAAGLTQNEWDALPKSWKKEMEQDYKGAPESVRKYVHEREKQVLNGISQYRRGHDSWNQVLTPFAEVLKEFPDANPMEILQTLAQNHIQMIQATPEERVQHAQALARGYGVSLTAAQANAVQAAQSGEDLTPRQISQIQRLLDPVLDPVRQTSAYVQKQLQDSATSEVDKFFSDPNNEFANELENDILQVMKSGQARSLPEAYELAILRNPGVKAKYFTSLASRHVSKPTLPSLPNLKGAALPPKVKAGTIDQTFETILDKHFPNRT